MTNFKCSFEQEVQPDNEFEKRIRPDVIPPNEIGVTFADIEALDDIKESLRKLVMLPLRRPDLYKDGLLLKPFVDEADSMLWQQTGVWNYEAMKKIKNEFMAHWEELLSRADAQILVLAAMNRPFDLDEAIIQRFERRIIGLPGIENREKISKTLLSKEEAEEMDYKELTTMTKVTKGYTGSDLKDLCVWVRKPPLAPRKPPQTQLYPRLCKALKPPSSRLPGCREDFILLNYGRAPLIEEEDQGCLLNK